MKIGVMSDTHGSLEYFEKAIKTLSDCDVLLHDRDIPPWRSTSQSDNVFIAFSKYSKLPCVSLITPIFIVKPPMSFIKISQILYSRIHS